MSAIQGLFESRNYSAVLVNLGSDYLEAFSNSLDYCRERTEVEVVSGRVGERIGQVKTWLPPSPDMVL